MPVGRLALTPAQEKCLAFVRDYIAREGIPPSLRELADGIGIHSTNGASEHLRRLEQRGYLRLKRRRSRGIELVYDAKPACPNCAGLTVRLAALEQQVAELRDEARP